MALKIFLLKLKEENSTFVNKRKTEHLYRKYAGIKISLENAIDVITSVGAGKTVEVLFNTNNLAKIETEFLKHSIVITPKEV